MAEKIYYTYNEGAINGDILMNIEVFDEIVKESIKDDNDIQIDHSKGFSIPGTKKKYICQIHDNDVSVILHVTVKYGVKVTAKMKELQRKIATNIKQFTNVNVSDVNIIVEDIEF